MIINWCIVTLTPINSQLSRNSKDEIAITFETMSEEQQLQGMAFLRLNDVKMRLVSHVVLLFRYYK